jgi:hypothetical protein
MKKIVFCAGVLPHQQVLWHLARKVNVTKKIFGSA